MISLWRHFDPEKVHLRKQSNVMMVRLVRQSVTAAPLLSTGSHLSSTVHTLILFIEQQQFHHFLPLSSSFL